jgi:putative NIF3 family GTP cyclohydrolase 1 type 2
LAPFTKADYKAVFKLAKNMGITFVKLNHHNAIYYLPRATARILESNPLERIAGGEVDITCPFWGRIKTKRRFAGFMTKAGSMPPIWSKC